MKFKTLPKQIAFVIIIALLGVSIALASAPAQAQVLNPYPSLYAPTATQFTLPFLQTYGNGYDMFSQQIIQFLLFLNGTPSNSFQGLTFGNTIQHNNSNSNSSNNNFDKPDVSTDNADDIRDDEAELNGEVDMNDAENGIVFFVYGEDEDQIEDVERDYDSYSDVDEDGDDLQKERVDSGFDGDDNFSEDVDNLDSNTEYFYVLCVEYEDEDGDDTLECGDVEEFETDN
jgi:hypothetical protein